MPDTSGMGDADNSKKESSPFEGRHGHSVEQFRGDMRVLVRVIRDNRTPIWVPFLMLGVVIYALFPVDVIPDLIPIGGMIDETVVFFICREFAYRFVPDEHIEEHTIDVSQSSSSPFGLKKAFASVVILQIGIIIAIIWIFGSAILPIF